MTQDRAKRINSLLGIMQFSYLAGSSCLINFVALYLSGMGFSDIQVGFMQAAAAGLMLVSQPALGIILDRSRAYRRMTAGVLTGVIVLLCLIPFCKALLVADFILILLAYAVVKQYGNVIDCWTYQLKEGNSQITFGKTRGLGSLGEGLTAFFTGYVISFFGYDAMFICTALLLSVTLAATLLNEDPPHAQPPEKLPVKRVRSFFLHQLGAGYWTYLTSVFFLNVALKLISIFASLMMKDMGGEADLFGLTVLLCGIAELPVFILVSARARAHNIRWWYLAGIILGLAGSLTAALATNLPVFMLGRVINTVSYAVTATVNLEYVNHFVGKRMHASALMLIVTVSSSGGHIVSGLLGGYLIGFQNSGLFAVVLCGVFTASLVMCALTFFLRRK